jgi:phospholipid/cholesterol/gamma-HCH transport system ATP-binding protein
VAVSPPELSLPTLNVTLSPAATPVAGASGCRPIWGRPSTPPTVSVAIAEAISPPKASLTTPTCFSSTNPAQAPAPVTSRLLDDLILQIRDNLETALVIVTHELASIFAIADLALFLDVERCAIGGIVPPADLHDHSENPRLRRFLTRGV